MAPLLQHVSARPAAKASGDGTSLQIFVTPSWRVAFVVAILLLLLAGGLAVFQYARFSNATDRVEHTYRVRGAIEDVVTRVVDGETALRGYLITEDESFLRPYDGLATQTMALADSLERLVADNPRQAERATALTALVRARVAEMATVREQQATGGVPLARARMSEGRGRDLMDEVRRLASEMRGEENTLLTQRAYQAGLSRRAALGFGIVSMIVAAILGLVGLSVNRTFDRRRLAFESELARRLAAEESAASASEGLIESERLMRSIVDSSADCIAVVDRDGRVQSINDPGLPLFGITDINAVKNRPWPEFWGPSGAQASQALADARDNGEGRFQGTTVSTHGTRWWDVIVTPVRSGVRQVW
jgi:PAS domain S-box-containing protein